MGRLFVFLGALNAFLALLMASWGAHDLLPNPETTEKMRLAFETGVDWHFGHALGLLLVGIISNLSDKPPLVNWAGWSLLLGMTLFCGSLYIKGALVAPPLPGSWGLVTPAGGVLLMLGWLLLTIAAARK